MLESCARCGTGRRYQDFKFCLRCKEAVEKEMEKSGYLTKPLPNNRYRPGHMRENTLDTKGLNES